MKKTLTYNDYRKEVEYKQMFCYQCEQSANGTGCTMSGVCGKKPDTAHEQDVLSCEMIALAKAMQDKNESCIPAVDLIVDGLFTTITNVNFDTAKITALSDEIKAKREKLSGGDVIKPDELFRGNEDIISLRSTLLFGFRGMAAYAHHARILGRRDAEVDAWFIKGMAALGDEHSVDEWLGLLMEFGGVNLKCMALLDEANTVTYGNPIPTQVPLKIEKGPFIVVTGHDLHDLQMLLEQINGKDVNVYTHGEMLPAHGYPELKKYSQLKGNLGTAWQNQQKEFDDIPAPILFTTNDLDIGSIGPFPRILDMGQCNDAYGAVQIAAALAGAFECGINDLPLTLVLSWYEQKAVCILLTLLSLGIKNIYIGPSVPAFFSESVLNVIVEKFGIRPISTPEQDLAQINDILLKKHTK